MEIFSGFGTGIGRIMLRQKLKSRKRRKKVYNLRTARTIGILFDATNPKCFEPVQRFYKELSGDHLKINVMGYFHGKVVPDKYLFKKDFIFFFKTEVRWPTVIKNKDTLKFIDKPFDILIDLNLNRQFLFDQIVALSKAKFKVGRFREEKNYYDLMINMEKEPTLEYFIQQVSHYLEMINRPDLTPKFQNI